MGSGRSRPRWWVKICWSRSVALTSSSRWMGLPDSRVRTKTMLITTSMLSSVCSTRPVRYRSMLLRPGDVLPVVEAHVARDQRPVPDFRSHAGDGVSGADGDAGDVLVEPGAHLVAHDPHAVRRVGLNGEPVDELVELRVLDEQIQRGLGVAGAEQNLPGLRRHQRRGVGQGHAGVRARAEI